jgi:hypothetical protein
MDSLFIQLEEWQKDEPWGDFLDAGTGKHSLKWLSKLQTSSWTAVTGDIYRAKKLRKEFSLRPQDQIISGNWLNHGLLKNRSFDVVLADYLLGAIEGFAPYFQNQLFHRLRSVVKSQLYVIGQEPLEACPENGGAKLINRISRLRDSCILLAGHRCYREYPLEWVKRQLDADGFRVIHSKAIPIRFGPNFINRQLDVCLRKLPFIPPGNFNAGLETEIEKLREEALCFVGKIGGIRYGSDYIISAKILE